MRYIDDWDWSNRRLLVLDIETTMDHETVRLSGLNLEGTGITYWTELSLMAEYLAENYSDDITIVTWNGIRFDFPILDDQCYDLGRVLEQYHHIDLMILDKLEWHDRPGGHSLRNVAKMELGSEEQKLTVDYDKAAIDALRDYLERDLEITMSIAQDMLWSFPDTTPLTYNVEHKVAELVADQVAMGVRYDLNEGLDLSTIISCEMRKLEGNIIHHLPYMELPKSKLHRPPKVQFKKDGTLSVHMFNYLAKHHGIHNPRDNTVMFTCAKYGACVEKLPLTSPIVQWKQMTPSDLQGIKGFLMERGWEPTEWNTKKVGRSYERTSPRITLKQSGDVCPALLAMGVSWIGLLAQWLTLRSRLGVLSTWNEKTRQQPSPHLPSDADTLGANTYRFTHKVIANVPRVTSVHGQSMRELFCTRDRCVWAGWDADSLEAKVEAAYVHRYDPAYAEILCSGDSSKGTDVHTRNLKAIPLLKNRDQAKTLKYAITYGAQPARIAKILRCTKSEAQTIYDDFWIENDALMMVKQDTIDEWNRNGNEWITAIDGRRISTRSEHSLLNAKFQSAGAIIMKYAMLICDRQVKKEKLNAYGLIRYHDEEIYECDPAHAERVLEIGCQSVKYAGQKLNLPIELSASGCLGNNWAEVH